MKVTALIPDQLVKEVQYLSRGKNITKSSSQEKTMIKNYWALLPKVEEKGIWLMAGEASSHRKLHSKGVGLIDLAITSTAQFIEAKIWTLDKKLLSILRPSEIFSHS